MLTPLPISSIISNFLSPFTTTMSSPPSFNHTILLIFIVITIIISLNLFILF